MTEYLIYFNQQWVGDHSEEWFRARGPLARAVVDEMKAAGAYVFAGGLEEDNAAFTADATSGTVLFTDGPYVESKEFLGGLTVVNVPDEAAARMWAGKIAQACGWPQEIRRFKPHGPGGGAGA
ncbi:YciI family protein [Catellatospora paridis]|uniref:YciI family protein n=1 Tax=Catellatospora paridis TaxID=1617086 RepID=UPI0012D3BF98|nr:YciI family protein [Catellatospora paridis]